jgi:hypothetical protein
MRIHTDALTYADMHNAARDLPEVFVTVTPHGSRKRDHAFELVLSAAPRKGRRYRNSGRTGADTFEAAAYWDEWGIVLSWLFSVDPKMTCWAYDGAADFHHKTGGRFRNVAALEIHPHHRFDTYDPATDVNSCKCGASRTWAELERSDAAVS